VSYVRGGTFNAYCEANTAATMSSFQAGYFYRQTQAGNHTYTTSHGLYVDYFQNVSGTCTLTSNYGIYVAAAKYVAAGSLTITNHYALYIADQAGAGVTLDYAIYIAAQTGSSAAKGNLAMAGRTGTRDI